MFRRGFHLLFHSPSSPPRTSTFQQETLTFDSGLSSATFHPHPAPLIAFTNKSTACSTQYLVSNRLPPSPPPPSHPSTANSSLCPPLHWHRHQTETFHILQGTAKFYLDHLDEHHSYIVPAGEVIVIPKRRWHTFRNASVEEDLELEFSLDPPGGGTNGRSDERFFRNTWMYRSDCVRAGVPRSMLQVLLFNYYAGVVLAFPGLGDGWIARAVGVLWNFWGGRVLGELLLGLKPSYEEYFDDGWRMELSTEKTKRKRPIENEGERVKED